jgi:hypothetical protein
MKNTKSFTLTGIFSLMYVFSFSQSTTSLAGLRFEQYDKADGYTIVEFGPGKKATYIMGGVLPFNGQSYREECLCTFSISNSVITLACECPDKELYPDPVEDEFTFDKQRKTLTSKRYRYTAGSAPEPSLKTKYIIWNQKE